MPFFHRLRLESDPASGVSEAITEVCGKAAHRMRAIALSVLLAAFAGATVSQARQLIAADAVAPATTSTGAPAPPKTARVRVHLIVDGKPRPIETAADATVGAALKQEQIVLGALDRCSSRLTTPVKPGMEIRVVRIRREKTVVKRAVPFGTRQRYSSSLPVGKKLVVTPGRNGVCVAVYQDIFKDGKRTSHRLQSEKTTLARQQVVLVGVRGMTLASRGYFTNKRLIEMVATGYGPGENGRWGAQTASGLKPGFGVVAVDPRFIPLGTRLYVDGYGYCVAGDTGGAIKGNRIDLGMDSRWEAMQVGRRRVRVLILD
ncbi:MAG: G5 domain-containing protein [Cytophagales bacterium]|nr:G5 domain-containing protein [Armatimonadota bacterium]